MSLNTEALVKKTGAFATIEQVSDNMGTAFAPYIDALLPIVVEHMNFEHSKAIKKLALKSFKNFLVAMGEPANIEKMQQSFTLYVMQLETSLTRHDEKSVKIVLKSLANNLRALNKHNVARRDFLTQA